VNKLDKIREELKKQQGSSNNKSQGPRDNSVFPHWLMPLNTSTTLRFLPDGNEDNLFFWVEKQMINLPFKGVKGTDHDKLVTVKVPCNDMFKPKSCPITQEIVPWFKTDMDAYARRYWKNRSYLFQGFVISTEMEEKEVPENPIRRFMMSKSIFKIIQESILDVENFDTLPTDYEDGVNFRIKKTMKTTENGEMNDYSTSTWERKETPLNESQLEAINEHGLYDLSTFLPPRPTDEQLEVIFEMFKASLDEQPYDADKWKDYYAPWGLSEIIGDSGQTTTTSSSDSNDNDDDDKPWDDDDSSDSDDSDNTESNDSNDSDEGSPTKNANDILEQLKARAKAS